MTENDSIKVYELAKELGIDSISLLDRLKDIDIKVKSHMSALTSDQALSARDALLPKAKKKKKKAATKTKTKKKVTAKKKAVVRRKTGDATPAVAAAPVEAAPTEGSAAPKAAPTIIRRRIRSTTPEGDVQETVTRKVITRRSAEEGSENKADTVEVVTSSKTSDIAPAFDPEAEAKAVAVQVEHSGKETTEMVVLPKSAKATLAAPSKDKKPKISILSTAKLETKSRLNVIEIQKPEPPKPARPGAAGAGDRNRPGGGRITRLTKESIDKMAEEEAAKKKRGAGDRPIRPEDVRFADYRKKEVSFIGRRRKVLPTRELRQTQITTPKASKRIIEVQELISVGELANSMGMKASAVMKKLMAMGQMATINQSLDKDTASLIATDFGYEIKDVGFKEDAIVETAETDNEADMLPRPPVVTVMGHVDHGKTSLLDAIKKTSVVTKEAGGITQHIGAYTVEAGGKQITFIDTPGHAAFTSMRARGANATDIVILVCAADDGVMPQTREAVAHAKAAGAPIVVAINKIDKPGANPEKVMQGLSELELLPEDWGGDTMFVSVSAIEGTNLDKLLEAVLLNAEILELKANPNTHAQGIVLEARLEKGRGPVASVLVQRGTLKKGDSIVSGVHSGRVRMMMNHLGQLVKEVTPGMAVEIAGMDGVPQAGETFSAVVNEGAAKKLVDHRKDQDRRKVSSREKLSLEQLMEQLKAGEAKELRIVLKADVFGSVEAVKENLEKLSTAKCKVNVVFSAAGGITESDVLLARASNALILGFNVRPETKARQIAESESVEVKSYSVIYELLDDVKQVMVGLLDKTKIEKFVGRAEVRETFSVPKIGTVAGTAVIDGKMVRNAPVRLLRDNVMLYEGKLSSLRRFKDDAKEVQTGYECGIGIEGYNDIKTGDIIEAFELEYITPELDS